MSENVLSSLLPFPKPCDSVPSKSLDENELKILTPDGSSEPFRLFADDIDNGLIESWKLYNKAEPQRLIARQLDTKDQLFRRNGVSLRIRGTYIDGELVTPDINIKTKKPGREIGMSRGEYEAPIDHAGHIDLSAIEKKYAREIAAGLVPDLVAALDLIKSNLKNTIEHFLIDSGRTRRVIGANADFFGFGNDQQFFGEMLYDKVRYLVRSHSLQETLEMTVTAGRRELELEPLHAPCEYNEYSGCLDHICKNIDGDEEQIAMMFFREQLQGYADKTNHAIEDAKFSKSGRGFEGWDTVSRIFNALAQERNGFSAVFAASASNSQPLLFGAKTPQIVPVPNINVPWELKAA